MRAVWSASFVGNAINIEIDSQSNYYVIGNSTTVISAVNLNSDGSVVSLQGLELILSNTMP